MPCRPAVKGPACIAATCSRPSQLVGKPPSSSGTKSTSGPATSRITVGEWSARQAASGSQSRMVFSSTRMAPVCSARLGVPGVPLPWDRMGRT